MTGDSISQPIIVRVPLVVYGKPTGVISVENLLL